MPILLLLLNVLAVLLLADFITGLAHWFEDAYAQDEWPILGPLIARPNIIHHHDPRRIAQSSVFFHAPLGPFERVRDADLVVLARRRAVGAVIERDDPVAAELELMLDALLGRQEMPVRLALSLEGTPHRYDSPLEKLTAFMHKPPLAGGLQRAAAIVFCLRT